MPLKRVVDLVLGSVLASAAAPIILLLALMVAVRLQAWPFFSQVRIGKDRRLFRLPKLRTLPSCVPPYACKASFARVKIPALCAFLRRTHLDELPQLFLVLPGTMSLVGPRPKMPDWAEPIDEAYASLRTTVRPGCTGLWQIGKHSHLRVADTPAYD
jgi:lipopolysaccharide/colanic/teichoic acid biosynthesis glycosyltransferase